MLRTLIVILFVFLSCQTKTREAIHFPKGGYAYVKDIPSEAISFFHYPLKDVISKKDSVVAAFYDSQFYPAFNEPNISLRPPEKTIIRYVYESSFIGYAAIMTMTEGKIIVKEKLTGLPYAYPDWFNLDSVERWHLGLMDRRYPLTDYKKPEWKRYNDSLLKRFPRLNDPHYYLSLLNKAKGPQEEPFTYREWTVSISKDTYRELLDSINSSGFWNMDFRDDRCVGEANDADGYSLEVATPEQYHTVISTPCTEPTKFQTACGRLSEVSGMYRSFKQYCDKKIKGSKN